MCGVLCMCVCVFCLYVVSSDVWCTMHVCMCVLFVCGEFRCVVYYTYVYVCFVCMW